ncbi:unnamed protein product, partial [Heterobilharzia americana]
MTKYHPTFEFIYISSTNVFMTQMTEQGIRNQGVVENCIISSRIQLFVSSLSIMS